ncbi:MAG: DegV family protein [candidate division WOR-3 bacterium]|nr:DegV family protein [candidate division WOR-3 bacterium]
MVKIVTDTVSDLPLKVAEELGVTIIPLHVRFGSEVYRDNVDLSTDEFYQKLISGRHFPSTAAPSIGEMTKIYQRLSEETDEIVSIHLSSKFSAFYEVALQAKNEIRSKCRIEVIDSLSATMQEGLLVIAAAEQALEGKNADEIHALVRSLIPKTHMRMSFDTLEYLRRGGRIGRAQAILGSILKVNPLVGIKDGEVHPYGRERSRQKALDWLYRFAAEFDGKIRYLAVEHATTPDEAEALADRLSSIYPREKIIISQVSPVVGTHVGPHVVGVSLLEK